MFHRMSMAPWWGYSYCHQHVAYIGHCYHFPMLVHILVTIRNLSKGESAGV